MAGQRGFRKKIDVREALFLANFYDDKSPTKGKGEESARAAGFPESFCQTHWTRIMRKFGDGGFRDSLRAVGITKPYLAMKLRHVLDTGDNKEMLPAIRMILANLGETTDTAAGAGGNVFTGPVMVIQGMTQDKLKALRGAVPQLTRAELEEQSNERSARRLELLKQGKLPPLPRIADGRVSQHHAEMEAIDAQAEDVPSLDGDNAESHRETEA